VVGFTTGSRGEAPGKKENLQQEMMMMIMIIIIIIIIIIMCTILCYVSLSPVFRSTKLTY
jgi:flagellar basal body-associated protein FliL